MYIDMHITTGLYCTYLQLLNMELRIPTIYLPSSRSPSKLPNGFINNIGILIDI